MTAGVQFDKDGNAVNPKVNYGGGGETPAPAASSPRLGGPRPAPAPAAPAPREAPALAPQARMPSYDPATKTWK
jgi:hypothetical protein